MLIFLQNFNRIFYELQYLEQETNYQQTKERKKLKLNLRQKKSMNIKLKEKRIWENWKIKMVKKEKGNFK